MEGSQRFSGGVPFHLPRYACGPAGCPRDQPFLSRSGSDPGRSLLQVRRRSRSCLRFGRLTQESPRPPESFATPRRTVTPTSTEFRVPSNERPENRVNSDSELGGPLRAQRSKACFSLGTRNPVLFRRRSILRKHLERHFPRERRDFLICVARVLRQSTLEHKITLVPRILSLTAFHCALKVEGKPVNNFSGKTQLVSLEFRALEKLIQKRSLVAFSIAESRNEARDMPRLFHRHLHKFPFFQKRIHPRKRLPTLGVLFSRQGRFARLGARVSRPTRLLGTYFRRNTQPSQPKHQSSNTDEVDFLHDTARLNRNSEAPVAPSKGSGRPGGRRGLSARHPPASTTDPRILSWKQEKLQPTAEPSDPLAPRATSSSPSRP